MTGLDGSLSYAGISSLSVPTGGATRTITVTVTWQLVGQTAAPAKFNSSYDMTVVNQGGKWFVRTIRRRPRPVRRVTMTYCRFRPPASPGAHSRPAPLPARPPCNAEMTYDLKETWSPGVPGSLIPVGAGCLTVGAGRFRLPARLIPDDPGREK